MKRLHSCLLVLLLFPAIAAAQSPEQLFSQGNEAYQQGNLPRAIELYESILHNGYVSGDLYYNLGNAYYRSGNIAQAILNYERARRLMPGDEDLRHNLQLANMMITDRIEQAPRLFLWDWWEAIRTAFSLETATWLVYACFVAFIVMLSTLLLGRSRSVRLIGLWGSALSLGFLGLFLLIFFSRVSETHRTDEAIVMAPVVTVKNSPDAKSTDAFALHAGVKVETIDRVGPWVKIKIADGKVGWMEEKGVLVI